MKDRGQLFVGDEGMIYSDTHSAPMLLPEEKFKDYPTPPGKHWSAHPVTASSGFRPNPPGSNFSFTSTELEPTWATTWTGLGQGLEWDYQKPAKRRTGS